MTKPSLLKSIILVLGGSILILTSNFSSAADTGANAGTAVAFAGLNQPVNPPCVPLSGTVVFTLFQFDSATTAHAAGDFRVHGSVVGHFVAQYFNLEPQGQGVIQMNGQHTVTFLDGSTLVTYDEILLQSDNENPGWAQVNSRLYVIAGTGAYAGATGLVHTQGEVNLFTLEGEIEVKGQVCLP